jgi:hypothetical protein
MHIFGFFIFGYGQRIEIKNNFGYGQRIKNKSDKE